MAGTGGRRPGAGRKPGVSKITLAKRRIAHYFDEKEIKQLVADLKEQAKTKPEILKFLAEQLFGKAPQSLELSGKDGKDLPVPIFGKFKE